MMTASLVILSGCKEEPLSVESEAAAEKLISVPGRVENAYIVTLARGSHAAGVARGVRAAHGGDVLRVWTHALDGFVIANVPEVALEQIRRTPSVQSVEPVVRHVFDNATSSWALDRIDQRSLPLDGQFSRFGDAAGVHIYVIDSGVENSHPELTGRVGSGAVFLSCWDAELAPDCSSSGTSTNDQLGHGTAVASIAAGSTVGVAPGATVHSVRIDDGHLGWYTVDAVDALEWIYRDHVKPAVVNFSGTTSAGSIEEAISNLYTDEGVLTIVSAGNDNVSACDRVHSGDDVLVVGGTTSQDARWFDSNWGTCVDLFAPAVNVRAADASSANILVFTGTSYAAPLATGVAALVLGMNPQMSPGRLRRILIESASQGVVNATSLGVGSPNRLLNSWNLHVDVLGRTSIPTGSFSKSETWTTDVTGGNGSYTYLWETRTAGSSTWVAHYGSASLTYNLSRYMQWQFELRLTVSSAGHSYTSAPLSVSIWPDYYSVTASVPSYITAKATYSLTGGASHASDSWIWEQRASGGTWGAWANTQNTYYTAYAGDYSVDWRLRARRVYDSSRDTSEASMRVCTLTTCSRPSAPVMLVGTAPDVRTLHFGSGAWAATRENVYQLYSLSGNHDLAPGSSMNPLDGSGGTQRTSDGLVLVSYEPVRIGTTDWIRVRIEAPGLERWSLSLDPDVSPDPSQDLLRIDPTTDRVEVSSAVGRFQYVFLAGDVEIRPIVRQFGSRPAAIPDPRRSDEVRAALMSAHDVVLSTNEDVRFAAIFPAAVTEVYVRTALIAE